MGRGWVRQRRLAKQAPIMLGQLVQGQAESKGQDGTVYLFQLQLRVWTSRHRVSAAGARQTSGFGVSDLSIASRRHCCWAAAGLSDTASLVAGDTTRLLLVFVDAEWDHALHTIGSGQPAIADQHDRWFANCCQTSSQDRLRSKSRVAAGQLLSCRRPAEPT